MNDTSSAYPSKTIDISFSVSFVLHMYLCRRKSHGRSRKMFTSGTFASIYYRKSHISALKTNQVLVGQFSTFPLYVVVA